MRTIVRNGNYTGDTYWNRRSFSRFHRISGRRAQERPRHRADKSDWNPEGDWIVVKDTHPAIISRQTYRQVVGEQGVGCLGRGRAARSRAARNSPYLLSGLLRCACGQAFHGQTTTKQKRRLSGEPVRTAYYVCSGYLQKGRAKCVRFLIPKEEMEAIIWQKVRLRLEALSAGGEELAARMRHVREVGNLEQQKTFLRGLIDRIEICPSTSQANLIWLSIPRQASC